jgi:hypothetical protein
MGKIEKMGVAWSGRPAAAATTQLHNILLNVPGVQQKSCRKNNIQENTIYAMVVA